MKKKLLLLLAVAMAVSLTGCGVDVPSDLVAVHMGSGPFEDKKPKGCVSSGTHDNSFTNDDYAYYPTSEREWDATGQDGADSGRFASVTKDNVEMAIPTTIRFTLITECDTLTDFHLRYGRRYGVEFDSDGSYNKEWLTLLRKLVADPADAALDRIVQEYAWRDVWNNPATKVELERRLNEEVLPLVTRTAKGEFFEGVTVLIGKPEPKNPELAAAVATEQTKVAQAQAEEAQAKADQAKALAQVAVAQAEAKKQEAVIAGYGGIDGYLKAQLIAKGGNPYQPTYLVGGTNPK